MLLPEPLLPTTPSTSPAATVNDTPSTARTFPSWVGSSTSSASTSSKGLTARPAPAD